MITQFKRTLAAGQEVAWPVTGTLIMIDGATAPFKIAINDGSFYEFQDGSKFRAAGEKIKNIRFKNTSVGAITINVLVTDGDYDRSVASELKVTNSAVGISNPSDVTISTTAIELAPANTDRKSVTIWSGTADLWIGKDATLTAGGVGGKIPAQSSVTIETTGSIFGIRAAGSHDAGYLEELAI